MAINNPYIPGDPYSYDLKWIVLKIKTLVLQGASLETALENLRQYVDDRFDNLDIRSYVNDALQEMYDDGSLALLIARYLDVNTPQLHGAVGDGETDDTAAIQAAIDSGYPVYIPDGKYLITDTLTVKKSGTKIRGSLGSQIIIGDELKQGNDAEWALRVYSAADQYRKLVSGAIAENADTINLTNADDVKAGMIASIVGDFTTSPWTSDNRGYITKGETNLINDVSGSAVDLAIPASIPFAASEIVTATFVEPVRNVLLTNLHFVGKNSEDDQRQYRGIVIINGLYCSIEDCEVENCGINSIELNSCVWSTIKNCKVTKAWTYEQGTSSVIGLGYALRDVAGNSCRILDGTVNEARHGVDVSGDYPAVNTVVEGNILRAGTTIPVMNTHGGAYKTIIRNNMIFGKTNLSGENITFCGNISYGEIQASYGRNFVITDNDLVNLSFLTPDTNALGNYIIIRNNVIRSPRICFINAADAPYSTVYGFVCENNLLLISGSGSNGVICDVNYAGASVVTFTGGMITNNNNSLNTRYGQVMPLPHANDMAAVALGSTEWDSVISNGLFIGVNAPTTNTIGARAYRSRLKVPVWYDGTNWLKADATTP